MRCGCVQVICLGAGFDTTYFQLAFAGRVDRCRYFEVRALVLVEMRYRWQYPAGRSAKGGRTEEEDS